jgi:hypothetical protein
MGHFRIGMILGAVVLALAAPAIAQPEGDIEMEPDPVTSDAEPAEPPPIVKDPKVAKKWLQAAQQLDRKGDALTRQGKTADAKQQYDNAITAYLKAIEAGDDVSVYYALALVADKAGNTVDALKYLKTVLAPDSGVRADITKKAQAKLDELELKVGVVMLMVTPDGSTISVGGNQIAEAPMAEPLVLMPGTYMFSFAAVGYQPRDLEVKVEPGSETERAVELEPVPTVIKPPVVDEPESEVVPVAQGPSKLPLYIGGGAAIGLFAVGTITGIMAVSRHGTFTDPQTSPVNREDAQASGKTLALVTDLCFVGAVGAAAFTTYWYLKKYKPQAQLHVERQAGIRPKVDVVPWVQPQASGLAVAGAF